MSIDLKFVELTADVLKIFFIKHYLPEVPGSESLFTSTKNMCT